MSWKCKECGSANINSKMMGEFVIKGTDMNKFLYMNKLTGYTSFQKFQRVFSCPKCGKRADNIEKIAYWEESSTEVSERD